MIILMICIMMAIAIVLLFDYIYRWQVAIISLLIILSIWGILGTETRRYAINHGEYSITQICTQYKILEQGTERARILWIDDSGFHSRFCNILFTDSKSQFIEIKFNQYKLSFWRMPVRRSKHVLLLNKEDIWNKISHN